MRKDWKFKSVDMVAHAPHVTLFPERLTTRHPTGNRETAFALQWVEENVNTPDYLNGGYGLAELMLADTERGYWGDPTYKALGGPPTERDFRVAATVVAFMGTNCGQAFLQDVRERSSYFQSDMRCEAWTPQEKREVARALAREGYCVLNEGEGEAGV